MVTKGYRKGVYVRVTVTTGAMLALLICRFCDRWAMPEPDARKLVLG